MGSFRKIIQTQGFRGLFKGNTASVVRVFPFSAIEFYTIEFCKNTVKRLGRNTSSFFWLFSCGAVSGLTAVSCTFPLDVARTRLAINTENSHIKENKISLSLINLWKEKGIRGLYKGYSVASIV
jgi:solute carrier family 25 protein 16